MPALTAPLTIVSVVATLCLSSQPDVCFERVVTENATEMECVGPKALQAIPKWMIDNGYVARGYFLQKWGCVRGPRNIPT